jgi:osmotically-inducible protein OsmY
MAKKEDDRLQMRIENKLGSHGLRSPCRIAVEVYDGRVTLRGTVVYEYQRRAAVTTVRSFDGVRGVTDLIKVLPAVNRWDDETQEQSGHEANPASH